MTLIIIIIVIPEQEIPDVPLNPKDLPEQTGWRKFISIKKD